MIAELPPLVRYSYNNIIRHLFCYGSEPNFDLVFCEYLVCLKAAIKDGIYIDKLKKKFKLEIFTCVMDTVARAKVLNTTQFNG